MKTEKLVESVQAVVFLFAFGGYGYSLYHFLSFYAQSNDLNWISIGLSAFLFMLPWALIGFCVFGFYLSVGLFQPTFHFVQGHIFQFAWLETEPKG